MAYLRRGLVTRSRNEIPSIHNKAAVSSFNTPVIDTDHDQPDFVLRKVKRIIRMGQFQQDNHVVELECGHTTFSRSTFQACCKACATNKAA